MLKKQVPEGVEDCLPAECCIKKNIESLLRNEFILSGYEELETPAYEFYDVFQSGVGSYMQESMIKFVDSKGRIIVLRPDITVPIARVAATKLRKGIKRLFYIQDSFAAAAPSIGNAGEFTQAGIELIGDNRFQADAEVIALAIQSLKTAGLKDTQNVPTGLLPGGISSIIDISILPYSISASVRGMGVADIINM